MPWMYRPGTAQPMTGPRHNLHGQKQVYFLFLTGGLRPLDPPISRPGGLPIWSLTGFGQPNKSLNFLFAPDGKDPGNVPFGTGGSEVVRDGKFPGNFNSRTTSGASQRHIHMLRVKWHSEKGDSVVSDGNFPGNFQMGEGLGYGVWDENGDWWGTSKNGNFEF